MNNLSSIFDRKSVGRSAQTVFCDRDDERAAFLRGIDFYLTELESLQVGQWNPQDLNRPRQNIMHFHGVGGIGKSALLSRLRSWVQKSPTSPKHWEASPYGDNRFAIATYDFHKEKEPSVDGFLIAIRSALLQKKKTVPAFDLLLAQYFAFNHPSVSLQSYIKQKTILQNIEDNFSLSSQIASSMGKVVSQAIDVSVSGSSLLRVCSRLAKNTQTSLQK